MIWLEDDSDRMSKILFSEMIEKKKKKKKKTMLQFSLAHTSRLDASLIFCCFYQAR